MIEDCILSASKKGKREIGFLIGNNLSSSFNGPWRNTLKGKILRKRIKRGSLGHCVGKKKRWSWENWVEYAQAKVLSGYVPVLALPCLVLRIGVGCCLRSPCEHQKPSWTQSWAANHQAFMLRTFLQLSTGLRTIDCLPCTSAHLRQCSSKYSLVNTRPYLRINRH